MGWSPIIGTRLRELPCETGCVPTTSAEAALASVVPNVDAVLERFLRDRRVEALELDPAGAEPIDEIVRLIRAGGKRLRPAFCYWGYRAAGGTDADVIWAVAASIELVHTMALIHDDVMDDDGERRGEVTAHVRQVRLAADRGQSEAGRIGAGVAIVAGDLAAAFADNLFASAGIAPERWAESSSRFQRMRLQLAVGAYLDVSGLGRDARTVAYLKGGAYTVEAPASIGAAVAAHDPEVDAALARFARPLGRAFQLLDDLADGDAPPGASREEAIADVDRAKAALDHAALDPDAAEALRSLADVVGTQ
jgi:geranylgeranyl diphosphate synthase type I